MSEPWHDVEWAAAYLGVSHKSIRRHAAQLGGVKLGARLLFRASEIDRFLESSSLRPQQGARARSAKGGAEGLRAL